MSESRKEVLLKALEAEVSGASVDVGTLFTDDVVGWSPYMTVSGLTALAGLSALRDVAFSNVVITLRGADEMGNKAFGDGSSRPITRGHLSSVTVRRWKQPGGMSNWP